MDGTYLGEKLSPREVLGVSASGSERTVFRFDAKTLRQGLDAYVLEILMVVCVAF